jgi:hypothetical protein
VRLMSRMRLLRRRRRLLLLSRACFSVTVVEKIVWKALIFALLYIIEFIKLVPDTQHDLESGLDPY